MSTHAMTVNGQVSRWQGKNVMSADNQSSILFQKPNIRTESQFLKVS